MKINIPCRCFGNRQSLKSRQADRLDQAYEPKENVILSNMQNTKRSPVGKFEKMTWKKEELKAEVES